MPTVGIRREDINRWERRAPLTPVEVGRLVSRAGLAVVVQPSDIRIYDEAEYKRAGATISEDLSGCDIILGIKEVPPEIIIPAKVYIIFAHVVKGQPANMPMLRAFREKKCSLIDYERITDENGRRLLFFGRYAGLAGMIDTLWTLGRRLAWEGYETPFAAVRPAWQYDDLEDARRALAAIGKAVSDGGLGEQLAPVVFGFAGYGNVSRGAQEILDLFPTATVSPGELPQIFAQKKHNDRVLYKVVFKEEDMVKPKTKGSPFYLQDYYDYPDKYQPSFAAHLPYLTALLNCIYWDARYPRLVTKRDLAELYASGSQPRLRVIGDISCDVNGAIEATVKYTSPEMPAYVYDVTRDAPVDGVAGNGPAILAVYNLPAELPRDSSAYFGAQLEPFVPAIVRADWTSSFGRCELPDAVRRATILYRGEFTPAYQYLERYL